MNSLDNIFYVNNLRLDFDLAELESLFSLVGDVESRRMELHTRSSRGASIGIFEMATGQQAVDCIERFHGSTAMGQTLSVTAERPDLRVPTIPTPPKKKRRR